MKALELDNFVESINNNEDVSREQMKDFLEQISYDFTEPLPDFLLGLREETEEDKDGVTYLKNPYNKTNQDLLVIDAFFEIAKQDYYNNTKKEASTFDEIFSCYYRALYFLHNYKFNLKKKYMKHIINNLVGMFKLD